MQLLLLSLVVGIFMHDQFHEHYGPASAVLGPWSLAAAVVVPKIIVGGLYWAMCKWAASRLNTSSAPAALRAADYGSSACRLAALALYVSDLALGALIALRAGLGVSEVTADSSRHGPILISELLIIAPTLGLLAFMWWAYYPIDRRLRTATIIARLDAGLPVLPIWTRGQYVLAQLRHQAGLILAPLLVIMAWKQVVEQSWFDGLAHGRDWFRPSLTGAGALAVFVLAPLIIRSIWDTVPLPAGDLRRHLTQLCHDHRVRVRDLLLWRTFGGTINGAVMGFIAPVRYILLTDALLDLMPEKQIEAVMVHELAHVRKHHMFWLMVSGFGTITLLLAIFLPALDYACRGLVSTAHITSISVPTISDTTVSIAAAALSCLGWAWVFGWISRRFERQADSFAVQHLARQAAAQSGAGGPVVIDPDSAAVMAESLQSVADLNHLSVTRSSWRHGSIRWRQEYLRGLAGQPAERLAIDRLVRQIKIAALLAAVAALLLMMFAPDTPPL